MATPFSLDDRGLCMDHYRLDDGTVGHCMAPFEHLGHHGGALENAYACRIEGAHRHVYPGPHYMDPALARLLEEAADV